MSQLLDFVPIVLFVAVFFAVDIYAATAALMIGVTLQLVVYRLINKPIGRELKLTFWASIIFGGLTLAFKNETFIQWKPTIVNWILGASLLVSHYVARQNLLQKLLGGQLELPSEVWARLNFGWACGFILAGVLNLVVAYSFSMEFWVSYKLIGGFGLTLTYIIITFVYLARLGLLETVDPPAAEPVEPAPSNKEP